MSKLKLLYLKLRYRKQIKQGFGLLQEHGQKVEITNLMSLERVNDLELDKPLANRDTANPQSHPPKSERGAK